MKASCHSIARLLLGLALTVSPLRAQLVNDGATRTLSNVTNNIPGDVTVGTNGSFTVLELSDNALLINSLRGMIGRNAPARSNEVRLISPTARWQMGTTLYVGSNGAFNRLVIGNGAQVLGASAVSSGILGQDTGSTNNVALVTGSGSLWSNAAALNIGFAGARNQLVVSNGARVHSGSQSHIGLVSSSTNNRVTVTGAGSVWSSEGGINLGLHGRGNTLMARAGGGVRDGSGFIGSGLGGFNLADLAGPGTFWTNTSEFHVGSDSSGNQLLVSDGAVVFAGSLGLIGRASGASLNTVTVTDPGSMWVNGGELYVGRDGPLNQLFVNNGGTVTAGNLFIGLAPTSVSNRLVVTNSGRVVSDNAFLGYANTASNNSAVIAGAGSVWSNQNALTLGSNSPGNSIEVRDGGQVFVQGHTFVGRGSFSTSNSILVSGPGSSWTNAFGSILYMWGVSGGSRNRLIVTNGAQMKARMEFDSDNNRADITGPGTLFDSSHVGVLGSSNRLSISDGASFTVDSVSVGNSSSGFNNELTVTGPGSLWHGDLLTLGTFARGNRLVLTNGGEFRSPISRGLVGPQGIIVGESATSTNNRVVVHGGTIRTASTNSDATLDVRRGTNVFNAGLIDVDVLLLTNSLGRFEFNGGTLVTRGASILNNNPFTVGRAGSTPAIWEVRGPGDHVIADGLTVGSGASFAQLIHTNGALLTNDGPGVLGGGVTSRSNSATVGGPGTRWWLSDGVVVGGSGSDNRLVVRDGASLLTESISYVGLGSASSNNEAVVTGPGTVWNSGSIYGLQVGDQGRNNRFVVSQGAHVSSADGEIGSTPTGSNNLALITDADSSWVNQEMRVGKEGPSNQLVISNGGFLLTSRLAFLGGTTNALRNSAVVTGPGSAWALGSNLFVGSNGGFCQLIISNGAAVGTEVGALGVASSSSNNLAVVTGPGSIWNCADLLHVGRQGAGNQLIVTEGAQVLNRSMTLGFDLSASNNLMLVRGAGTLLTNSEVLNVGVSGSRNRLIVDEGARVESVNVFIGTFSASSSNELVVSGPGSFWQAQNALNVGNSGSGNRLVITNGGRLRSDGGTVIGAGIGSTNNEVLVTGVGSVWTNRNFIFVGNQGSGNRLIVRDGAELRQEHLDVTVGASSSSTNNRLVVDGGSLRLLDGNPIFGAVLDIRRGTNVLNAGLIETGSLLLTNTLGSFEFNGGTLITHNAVVSNTRPFVVGASGATPATWTMLSGPGTHSFGNALTIGGSASQSRLLVTNGAMITSVEGFIGSQSHFNHALISGPGSRWDVIGDFAVGISGSSNSLVISNGGQMTLEFPFIGTETSSSNNQMVVTGNGSRCTVGELLVGAAGPANQLLIADNALVIATNTVVLGFAPATSRNNRLHIPNGELFVTNGAATGTLDMRHGTNRLDAGFVHVDRLRVTNSAGAFELNGGMLRAGAATVANGHPFTVGNGASQAVLHLPGGTHRFANNLVVASNGFLMAFGNIDGTLIVSPGGRFLPGAPFDPLSFVGSVILQGITEMNINKFGGSLTNDLMTATAGITYGGELIVLKLTPDALAAGDRFRLFNAAALTGSFSTITLPPLGPGLNWTNKLLVDGSIEVIGASQPGFSSIGRTGTNLVFSGTNGVPGADYFILTATNVALPGSNWVSLVTNQFGPVGEFSFTNAIIPGEPERYFRLRSP